jgi:hypothetical protein
VKFYSIRPGKDAACWHGRGGERRGREGGSGLERNGSSTLRNADAAPYASLASRPIGHGKAALIAHAFRARRAGDGSSSVWICGVNLGLE